MDSEHVAVLLAIRRCSATVLGRAEVVADMDGAIRQAHLVSTPRSCWQLGNVTRDVEHHPVPETTSGRGIGVVAGHSEAPGLLGEVLPSEVRREVRTCETETVEAVRVCEKLTVADIVAHHLERRYLGKELEGQWCLGSFGHGEPPLHGDIGSGIARSFKDVF